MLQYMDESNFDCTDNVSLEGIKDFHESGKVQLLQIHPFQVGKAIRPERKMFEKLETHMMFSTRLMSQKLIAVWIEYCIVYMSDQ